MHGGMFTDAHGKPLWSTPRGASDTHSQGEPANTNKVLSSSLRFRTRGGKGSQDRAPTSLRQLSRKFPRWEWPGGPSDSHHGQPRSKNCIKRSWGERLCCPEPHQLGLGHVSLRHKTGGSMATAHGSPLGILAHCSVLSTQHRLGRLRRLVLTLSHAAAVCH